MQLFINHILFIFENIYQRFTDKIEKNLLENEKVEIFIQFRIFFSRENSIIIFIDLYFMHKKINEIKNFQYNCLNVHSFSLIYF